MNPPEGIIAGPINEENFFEWEALITSVQTIHKIVIGVGFCCQIKLNFLFCSGPEGTCFEGGVFPAKLVFPSDYPLSPPKMQFTCEMFHPNSK